MSQPGSCLTLLVLVLIGYLPHSSGFPGPRVMGQCGSISEGQIQACQDNLLRSLSLICQHHRRVGRIPLQRNVDYENQLREYPEDYAVVQRDRNLVDLCCRNCCKPQQMIQFCPPSDKFDEEPRVQATVIPLLASTESASEYEEEYEEEDEEENSSLFHFLVRLLGLGIPKNKTAGTNRRRQPQAQHRVQSSGENLLHPPPKVEIDIILPHQRKGETQDEGLSRTGMIAGQQNGDKDSSDFVRSFLSKLAANQSKPTKKPNRRKLWNGRHNTEERCPGGLENCRNRNKEQDGRWPFRIGGHLGTHDGLSH